jgi:hypothetical protein
VHTIGQEFKVIPAKCGDVLAVNRSNFLRHRAPSASAGGALLSCPDFECDGLGCAVVC